MPWRTAIERAVHRLGERAHRQVVGRARRGPQTRLGALATLELVPAADHSFHVPARSGSTHADVLADLAGRIDVWSRAVLRGAPPRAPGAITTRSTH